MAVDDPIEPQRIHITIRPRYGTFTDRERRAIIKAVRGSSLGEVRIDEAVEFNLGLGGGPGGLPITIDVWLNIGEQAVAALLAVAITKGIAPIVQIVRKRIARLVAIVHGNEGEPISYVVDPPSELEALTAMPADYEVTVRTESRSRIWRDGRWEHYEVTTKEERGSEPQH